MAGLKHRVRKTGESVATFFYRLRNILSGWTPVHLVVTGPDDGGARALVDTIAGWFSPSSVVVVWGPARFARRIRARVIVSWDPDDATRADQISAELSATRRLGFVLACSDPHHLVSEVSPMLSHEYSQGGDYRLHVDGAIRSFTQPGVISRTRDALSVLTRYPDNARLIARGVGEEHSSTRDTILGLVSALGGPTANAEGDTRGNSDGEPGRPDEALDAHQLARTARQLQRFPELVTLANDLGYPALDVSAAQTTPGARGTIIAFHTPDEVYRAEAERLKKSLDKLGLDYKFTVVEPESNWVRTTLLKPSWILPVRQEIRGPLLYIDVDAYVHEDPWPHLDGLDGDMGAVVYSNGQLNSATLWINDTEGAQLMLSLWLEGTGARRDDDQGDLTPTGENGDQGVLRLVVEREEKVAEPRFRLHRLPPNLATIFDRTDEYRFGPVAIEQLQVSREATQVEKRLSRRRDRLAQLDN